MLPQVSRLPHGSRLIKGISFRTSLFVLKAAPNDLGISRFGIIISKKVDKRAVKRNRMRRLLQAFIQNHPSLFPTSSDYLFIVNTLFEELPQGFEEELALFFEKK